MKVQVSSQLLLEELNQKLEQLRCEMLEMEGFGLNGATEVHAEHLESARNLMHYLALRCHDIRQLQSSLAGLGLSSLGRTEGHVLKSIDAVVRVLQKLAGSHESFEESEGESELRPGAGRLEKNTEALLGPAPAGRKVRIMVTMPPEAATDYELVRDLLAQGMDCIRINCAHDGPDAWSATIENLRRAEKDTKRFCKIAMDLAGPKLRTGPIEPGLEVLKYRPKRDTAGRVISPARIWLTPISSPEVAPERADAVMRVPLLWLARLKVRDQVRFTDARKASRSMTITEVEGLSR